MNHVVGWLVGFGVSIKRCCWQQGIILQMWWVGKSSFTCDEATARRRRDGGKSGDGDLHIIFELEIPGQSTPSNENCIVSHMTGCWLLLVAAAVWYRQVV